MCGFLFLSLIVVFLIHTFGKKIPLVSVRTINLQAEKNPPYHSQFSPKRVITKQGFFLILPPFFFAAS